MLREIRSLKGRTIQALDGQIGAVVELYFDELLWKVRYVVAESGNWLPGRKLLIARQFLGKPQGGTPVFPVLLNKRGIEKRSALPSTEERERIHLRSTDEMVGFQIRAERRIGVIEDFIADDRSWHIRYFVVSGREWLPNKKVLLAPAWSQGVNWETGKVQMDLACEAVQSSPAYDPNGMLSREYEARLYEHYGRRKYWMFR